MEDMFKNSQENFEKGFFASKAEMKYFPISNLSNGDTIDCREDNKRYIYLNSNPYNIFTGKWSIYDPEKFRDAPIDGEEYLRSNSGWVKGGSKPEDVYTKTECDNKFVTKTVNNLVNYYLKSETYTQQEVRNLIGQITTINFEVVESLPEEGEFNKIYLVRKEDGGETNDVYIEYIWVEGKFEAIGSTTVDLSNYYNKTEADGKFALKTSIPDISGLLSKTEASSTYATKTSLGNKADKITKQEVSGGTPTQQLSPNKFYVFGEVTELNITLGAEISGIYNQYLFQFTSGSTAAVLNVPDSVKWDGGTTPVIEANKIYQVSIVNNISSIRSVAL